MAEAAPGAAPPGLSALGALAQAGDPDRFEAALFASEPVRERLFALYAFNLEIARAAWRTQEPHIALMRLQFWRDIVSGAAEGAQARAHEVAQPLHALIAEGAVDPGDLDAMIEAREMETEADAAPDHATTQSYLDGTAGALMRAATQIAVGRSLSADEAQFAGRVGVAAGLARLLEATPLLAAHGKIALPLAPSDRAQLLGGATSAGARTAIAALAAAAAAQLADARRRRRTLPRAARPALLSIWRADRVLAAAQRPDLDIFRDFGPESPARRRALLLWRAAVGW